MIFRRFTSACLCILAAYSLAACPPAPAQKNARPRPLLREFIGLNVHTVLFKPEQYRPVTRLLRNYHPFNWDIGKDTSHAPSYPFAVNRVNWEELYGGWKKAGYDVNASVMFDDTLPPKWKDLPSDAYAYGFIFGRFFGPSGSRKLVSSVEIGNEPGDYSDEAYRTLFLNAAQGIRKADPHLKIVTCAADVAPSAKYHKSLTVFKGLEAYYDVINVHAYAQVEGYPTWRRSYPEDPSIEYLKRIRNVMAWRDKNAPGKPVWITEFGWDSTTQPQAKEGAFKDWVGVTDTQQARYLVRSLLVFSAMDLGRAYIYWFNDDDLPSVHGSSGLTRKGEPKPSFHAVAHLQRTLGDYRFVRAVEEKAGDVYLYEYAHATDPKRRIWAAWSPTGSDRKTTRALAKLPGAVERIERMPLGPGEPETLPLPPDGKELKLEIGESPVFLKLRLP